MEVRVSRLQLDPGRIDDAVKELEEETLPNLKGADGFRGFTLFVDRSSGKMIGSSYWDSQEQMEASEELGNQARSRAADTGGAQSEPEVERFEVALDTFVD